MSDTGTAAYIPGWVDEARSLLTWISAEGKLSAMAPPAAYIGPRLSPDCKKVAVRVDSPNGPDFHVWDIERGVLTRVTFDARTKSPVTVWTPDGRFLVYGAEVAGLGIYAVPSDGSAPPRKILETAAETEPESFSPDGKWLLLSEQGKISSAPVEIRNDGLQLGKPTGFAVTGAYPRFSPDGRWVVYGSYESGISQIFARRFPNAGAKYQISRAGGINPVWPRGKQLFFLSSQGIMGVNCAAQDESLHCDTPRLWSDQQMTSRNAVPTFDVAADGRVLALTPPLEAGSGRMRVHFLFNFGANAIHSQ
jgi:Tol biopolymer transport system component